MQAYDVKRKRIVEVMKLTETGAIAIYTVPNNPKEAGKWYFPLIENGKDVEPYRLIEHEQLSIFDLEEVEIDETEHGRS